jgi:sec-independent protein translocase protein TatA
MLTIANVATRLAAAPMLAWAVGWQEVLIIVVVVLILFGGRKIPELAKGIGKGLREFKREMQGVKRDFEEAADAADEEPVRPRRRKRRRKPRPEASEDEDSEAADEPEDEPARQPESAGTDAE